MFTINNHSNHRKHRYELVKEPKKHIKRIFLDQKLVIKVLMDCRVTLE